MKMSNTTIRNQIMLIEDAMKAAGIWSDKPPDWVSQYKADPIPDIWQWLQFIYLPLRINDVFKPPQYLAPQVTAHAGDQLPEESLLLQRIVELDSLTSTLHHT
jgi:uncharacterized protein YqcC (DUF446 family)